jgi:hypothetical protein
MSETEREALAGTMWAAYDALGLWRRTGGLDDHMPPLEVPLAELPPEQRENWIKFADAILASGWLAQVKATARAEALGEAADAWQSGEWTAITVTTRLPRPEATIGTAQVVTDWLRDRARPLGGVK